MPNKPIICFHVGYIPDLNNTGVSDFYGSEETILQISKLISHKYDLFIFGESQREVYVNDIQYYHSSQYYQFQKENEIDTIILFRYIYPIFDFELKAKRIILWITDTTPLPFYNSLEIQDRGYHVINNFQQKIDYFITGCNWHKNYIKEVYNIDEEKIKIISPAINLEYYKDNIKRTKNRFIWTSHGYRGFHFIMEDFEIIRSILPDAELFVFRDNKSFSDEMLQYMRTKPYIHYKGKISNKELIVEFQKSDYWYYPTDFEETFCMSAAEAQMAGCVCITSDKAALSETVGNRGILIKEHVTNEEYKNIMLFEIFKMSMNEDYKNSFREKGMMWAKDQRWENRANDLLELLKNNCNE